MQASRQRYRQHCADEPSVPLFSRDWWLDAVCEGAWDSVMVEKDGRIAASMPICVKDQGPFRYLGHPPLTPVLGPWLRTSDAKYATRLAEEKRLMGELIDQLPRYDQFSQKWHRSFANWQPFYWRGFEQTTLYTYVLDNLDNLDELWQGLDSRMRGEIRKAQRRYGLAVRGSEDIDGFIELNEEVFRRRGRALPYSRELVTRLDKACRQHGARKIWIATDHGNRIHAAIYVVWDRSSAYYLMGGVAPEFRTTGAASLLLWEAIRHASSVTREFDFEGSMVESIERFFRGFGARQTPYFSVSHTKSRLLRLRHCMAALLDRR
jgi:hypothetical protein